MDGKETMETKNARTEIYKQDSISYVVLSKHTTYNLTERIWIRVYGYVYFEPNLARRLNVLKDNTVGPGVPARNNPQHNGRRRKAQRLCNILKYIRMYLRNSTLGFAYAIDFKPPKATRGQSARGELTSYRNIHNPIPFAISKPRDATDEVPKPLSCGESWTR